MFVPIVCLYLCLCHHYMFMIYKDGQIQTSCALFLVSPPIYFCVCMCSIYCDLVNKIWIWIWYAFPYHSWMGDSCIASDGRMGGFESVIWLAALQYCFKWGVQSSCLSGTIDHTLGPELLGDLVSRDYRVSKNTNLNLRSHHFKTICKLHIERIVRFHKSKIIFNSVVNGPSYRCVTKMAEFRLCPWEGRYGLKMRALFYFFISFWDSL